MTTPYPDSTELKDNFSIFHLALRHQVTYQTFKACYPRLEQHNWQLHEYLETDPYPKRQLQRTFLPKAIFTPYAHESLFGQTWLDRVPGNSFAQQHKAVLKERLNPNGKICPYPENLLLTQKQDSETWWTNPLQLNFRDKILVFTIEWVDLWLFADNTGILAFKTKLKQVQRADQVSTPRLDDLNIFNRRLRYTGGPLGASQVMVRNANNPTQTIRFWEELAYSQWLGLNNQNNQNVLMLGQNKEKILDRYTRYSKLFTVAQMANIRSGESEFIWNRPITDPDFTAKADYTQFTNGQGSPQLHAYQHLMLNGYPNMRDMLLLELATTSGEGQSWHGERKWQYDTHYVKRLLTNNSIKIWSYWNALALRDICAFISYDDNMPLLRKKQVESLYYPLYIFVYHQRFRLDCFSQEVIDYNLGDCVKSRNLLENFHAFHNQYCFNEVTVDFQGIEITDKMRQGLEVDNKYKVVAQEIKTISGFIDRKMQAGRQILIAFLILAFYPFQYFGLGKVFHSLVEKSQIWQIVGLNVAFFLLIIWLFWWVVPRRLGFLCRLFARVYHRHQDNSP
ncbi:MAG: hypothetical protein VSS75_012245 [Candidatus Parabeggiatoa sp.]|nr:hypothetical protein [Candidatus Parabeggiatoa sp.]